MKLKSVEITNIASVEHAEIEFTNAPIDNSGLFLITGNMGTGKTTLLDAICLALYGNTPRLANAGGGKMDFGAYGSLTPSDSRNLLRRGARNAESKVVFDDDANKECIAIWSVQLNKNNNFNDIKRSFERDGQIENKRTDVQNAIDKTIKITFDQFCRTVMLPQGQFTAFLKGADKDKADILEKLTGTEKYSRVGKKIHEKYTEAKNEYEKKYAVLEGRMGELKDVDVEQINEKQKELDASIIEQEKVKKGAEEAWQWRKKYDELQEAHRERAEELKKLQDQTEAPLFVEQEKTIERWTKTIVVRGSLKSLDAAERGLEGCQKREQELLAEYMKLLAGKLYLEQSIQNGKKKMAADNATLGTHAPYKVIYENLQTIEAQLKQALNLGQKITQTSNENDALNAGLPSLKKAVVDAKKAEEAAQKDIESQDKELERINQAIEQCNPQELENEKKQLEDLEGKLRAAEKEMTSLDGKIETLNRLKKDIDDLKSEKEGKQQQLAKSKLELPSLETAYGIAKEVYENVKLSIGDAAKSLRAQIQTQHAKECPVCRQSLENVLIESEDALLGKMKSYKEKAEEAKKNFDKKNVEMQTLEGGIAELTSKDEAKSKELDEAKKDYAVICASAVEKLGQLGINAVAESIDSAEAIEGLKESVAEKRGEYDKQRNSLNQRQQQLTTLQGEQSKTLTQKNNLTKIKGEKDRDLQNAENKVKESEDKIKSNEQLVEQYREEREKCIVVAEEYLSGQANWQQSWSQNPKEYIEEWNKRNDAYKALVEDIDNQKRIIGDAEKTLQAVNGSAGSITTAMPQWQIDISGIVASRVSDNLQGAFSALDVSIATHKVNVGNYSRQRDEGRTAVDTFLSQNAEYDESLLRKLNELEGNRIEALKKAHEEVKEKLSATNGALESKQKEIDQHKGTPHSQESETLAIDELEARKNESDGKLTAMQKEQHENKFKLDEYNKKKEQLAKDQQEVDALRVKRDRWNTLDDIFGGMDGNNFKKKAQSYLLSFLLDAANAHLSYLEPRYKLESIPDTLTIVLHDNYRQNYNSPVDTLSGGESFLVSLALALALSTINNRGLAIDTLFIDEGFGTLGEPELNRVVELLENLQRHQGKRVGIISHVELLATRIPVQIQATRIDESRTTLNVVDTRLAKRC